MDELPVPTRVDLAFPVEGRSLPRDHRALLAAALAERLPWLGVTQGSGVHRLNVVAGGGDQVLLSARTRLLLRVPREQAAEAVAALSGAVLRIGDAAVLFLPGECMIEFQLFAQSLRPDDFVAVAAYGDLGPGYICTEKSFSEGGYEPTASRAGKKAEWVLKDVIRKLLGARPDVSN